MPRDPWRCRSARGSITLAKAALKPRRFSHWVACGFGVGLIPFAPGTFGTLLAMPLYWLMQPLSVVWYIALTLAIAACGVWVTGRTARDLGVHDHGAIVFDEIVGYLVAMAFAPAGWVYMLAGFGLFRLFDIAKPFPLRRLERLPGGLGIMADDLGAGVYAALCMHLWVWVYAAG